MKSDASVFVSYRHLLLHFRLDYAVEDACFLLAITAALDQSKEYKGIDADQVSLTR